MPPDPLTAALHQLAAHHDRISRLDVREASHFATLTERLAEITALITAIGRTLDDETAALARLEALDHHVTELTAQLTGVERRSGFRWERVLAALGMPTGPGRVRAGVVVRRRRHRADGGVRAPAQVSGRGW